MADAARGSGVVLIGYRGAGKSTVGRLLAERLNMPFVDTDKLVVRDVGRSIVEIFEQEGEAGFRRYESEAIADLLGKRASVVSVGGGAITVEANMTVLRRLGTIVWLTAPPEVLYGRIAEDASTRGARPALTSLVGLDEVKQVLADREPIYRKWADVEISTDEMAIEAVVERIASRVGGTHNTREELN